MTRQRSLHRRPDAALKAAMDYYAHQLSGLPKLRSCSTQEASVADSELPSNEKAIRVGAIPDPALPQSGSSSKPSFVPRLTE